MGLIDIALATSDIEFTRKSHQPFVPDHFFQDYADVINDNNGQLLSGIIPYAKLQIICSLIVSWLHDSYWPRTQTNPVRNGQ